MMLPSTTSRTVRTAWFTSTRPAAAASRPSFTYPPESGASALPAPGSMRAIVARARARATQWWREREPGTRKTILGLGIAYAIVIIIVLIIGPNRIFRLVARAAVWLATQSFGIPLALAAITVTSIPPIPGYGLAITLCGLSFGSRAAGPDYSVWKGWFVAASGCLIGASVAFVVSRLVLRYFATHRRVQDLKEHRHWRAVEEAVRQRGLAIIVLLRFAPFPFCYSNLAFASLQSVSFPRFFLATLCITPKLLLHVFVGSRAYELLDQEGETLPLHVRLLNWAYIVVGALIGWATGHYLWVTTQRILADFERREELNGTANGRHAVDDEEAAVGSSGPADPSRAVGVAHGNENGNGRETEVDPLSGERSPLLGTSPST